jgi:tetratricopeptide (TPR) repeat protein
MKISKHTPLLWYLCISALVVLILILTGIAFAIPFSVPMVIGIAGTILGYYLYTKKPKEKEIKIEEKKGEKEITVPKPPIPYFAHLYPLQKNFTGRENEREELTEWLKNDSNPVFIYVALGGMGKSALTWYWLKEDILEKESKTEGVIWWSFYDKEAGFDSFLNHSIEYASEGKVDAKKIESTRDKMDELYALLSENQFILVLDGVERLLRAYAGMGSPYQGDDVKEDEKKDYKACIEPNCGTFLQMLASVPKTKTLITTRICPKELDDIEGCIKKDLTQMDKEDAVEFFERQGVKGTRAEIEEVCRVYGFHPLSLRLLSGMIVRDLRYNCDIKAWTKHNPLPKLIPKEHNILELAYNSLGEKKQKFISKVSAFRTPMDYDAVAIFNDFGFGREEEFNGVLLELVDRGLLFREEKSVKFDMHPIVRRYCYDRLSGKKRVHSKLKKYFAAIPAPEKIESVDDLAPVIELYHHTVRAGRYDEAMDLFRDRLAEQLYYRFGAYQTRIELLRALFPDGEDKLPRLKKESAQGWTLNALANSYSFSGQSRWAVLLLERVNDIYENMMKNKQYLAIGLGNLAHSQIQIGELDAAESNFRRGIEICCEIEDEFREAIGHNEISRLLTYQGKFEEAESEILIAMKAFKKINEPVNFQKVWAYRSIRSLFMSNAEEAIKSAIKARELADAEKVERDIIRAEYLLGGAYLMKGNFVEAEKHLAEALTRDRKINLVELEPDILLEFAKLRFKENHKKEALKFAEEALQIADRCEYRLKQADIHNFLAEFYLDAGDLEKAREHGESAKERAECRYKPALEKAEKMLNEIEQM